jgi:tetratricopeptide (TPR) repeat protein
MMKMVKMRVVKFALIILCTLGSFAFVPRAAAQVDVRGQILLPDGNLPSSVMRFYLTSDDGRVNEIRFTDSNGRFVLERLSNRIGYAIAVDSDGASYGASRYSFMPAYEQVVRFTLSPLPSRHLVSRSTVSAASGYKPDIKVVALYERALKEIRKKHNDAGERLLREAIATDPKYPAPLNDLGVLLMGRKNYEEAVKVLKQAVEADPKFLHALLNLGITMNHLGKYEDAMNPLREAMRLEPGLVAAHLHLGIALVETDQLIEADKELGIAAKSPHSDKSIVHLYQGKLYARTGDFDKSIAAFNAYLQDDSQSAQASEVRSLIARMQDLKAKRH